MELQWGDAHGGDGYDGDDGATAEQPLSERPPPFAHAARLQELAQSKAGWRATLEARRRAEEAARMAAECTFQPNAAGGSRAGRSRSRSGSLTREHRGSTAATRSGGVGGEPSASEQLAALLRQQQEQQQQKRRQQAAAAAEDVYLSYDGSIARAYLEAPPAQAAAAASSVAAARGLARQRATAAVRAAATTSPSSAATGAATAPAAPPLQQRHAVVGGKWVPLLPPAPPLSAPGRMRGASVGRAPTAAARHAEPAWQPAGGAAPQTITAAGGGGPSSLIPVLVPRWTEDAGAQPPQTASSPAASATEQPAVMRRRRQSTGTAASTASGAAASAAAARLYAEADTRALARARAQAALEAEKLKDCTFTPSLNAASLKMAAAGGGTGGVAPTDADAAAGVGSQSPGGGGGDGAPRVPLHQRTADIVRRRAASLAAARVESVLAHPDLTFQPRISEASARLAAARARAAGLPVAADGGDVPADAAAVGSDEAAGALPPSVASTRRLTKLAEELAAKRAARAEAAAREEAARCTFAPRISEASERLAAQRNAALGAPGNGDDGAGYDGEDGGGNYTAGGGRRGSVATTATRATSAAGGGGGGSAFLARQAALAAATERERARVAAEEAARARTVCTFSPDIGNADEVLALTRPALVAETDAQRVARLAREDAAAVAAARRAVSEGYYSQFTYTPAIDPISRAVGRSRTAEQRHRNDEGAAARARAAEAVERQFAEAHPFKPTLVAGGVGGGGRRGSKAYDGGSEVGSPTASGDGADVTASTATGGNPYRLAVASDPAGVAARIAALQRAKADAMERLRRQVEYDQLKECTFAPATNGGRVPLTSATSAAAAAASAADGDEGGGGAQPPPVVVVRGLGRYLELRELSRQLEEDQR